MKKYILITIVILFIGCLGENKSKEYILEKDLEIGILEGDENYMFGAISDIDVDEKGNIYVLDLKFSRIQEYDENGKFLFSLPVKEGDGPDEVHSILSMAIAENGNIWILGENRKIIIFNREGKFLKSFILDFGARHILPCNENVIVLGLRKNYILHEINNEGKIVKSFAEPYEIPSKYSSYKEIPFLKTPIRADNSWDGEIFLINPYRYEIRIYRNYKIKKILKWENEAFIPLLITQANVGIGIVFPYISVLKHKNRLFITIRGLGREAINHFDIFENFNHIYSLKVEGFPYAVDKMGRFYFAEEEDFPKVVRYVLNRKSK